MLTIKEKPETRRDSFGTVSVPGTRAGAIVSLGLVILAWIAIPVARPFILGTIGLGAVVAWILQWKHKGL